MGLVVLMVFVGHFVNILIHFKWMQTAGRYLVPSNKCSILSDAAHLSLGILNQQILSTENGDVTSKSGVTCSGLGTSASPRQTVVVRSGPSEVAGGIGRHVFCFFWPRDDSTLFPMAVYQYISVYISMYDISFAFGHKPRQKFEDDSRYEHGKGERPHSRWSTSP